MSKKIIMQCRFFFAKMFFEREVSQPPPKKLPRFTVESLITLVFIISFIHITLTPCHLLGLLLSIQILILSNSSMIAAPLQLFCLLILHPRFSLTHCLMQNLSWYVSMLLFSVIYTWLSLFVSPFFFSTFFFALGAWISKIHW